MLAARRAVLHHRARQALGIARQADRRSQLHERLVEFARLRRIHKLAGQFLNLVPQCSAAAFAAARLPAFQAAQHPLHVAVHNRHHFTVSDAGNGRRRVSSDAGQQTQLLGSGRQVALVMAGHVLRRLVQHARTAIVAQAAPLRQHLLLRRQGQRDERGKPSQKSLVPLHHHRDAGLLQHDL